MKRTPETFEAHLRHRVAACGQYFLLLSQQDLLGHQYMIVPHSCMSGYCPTCRQSHLRRLRSMLVRTMAHHRWRLVTLTFAQREVTPVELLKALKVSFTRLSKRLRRAFPHICYVRTIEVHKSGYPHIHMVVDAYVPVSWLQLHWKECGGGMVDIREGKRCDICGQKPPCDHYRTKRRFTHHDAAKYLTEEIEKVEQDPHQLGVNFWCAAIRSITTSRTLTLKAPDSPWRYQAMAKTEADLEYYYAFADPTAYREGLTPRNLAKSGNVWVMGPGVKGNRTARALKETGVLSIEDRERFKAITQQYKDRFTQEGF